MENGYGNESELIGDFIFSSLTGSIFNISAKCFSFISMSFFKVAGERRSGTLLQINFFNFKILNKLKIHTKNFHRS